MVQRVRRSAVRLDVDASARADRMKLVAECTPAAPGPESAAPFRCLLVTVRYRYPVRTHDTATPIFKPRVPRDPPYRLVVRVAVRVGLQWATGREGRDG